MRIKDDTCYLTDNGAVYCGEHLGATARATGRDISGQRIDAITPADAAEADRMGIELQCERPGCSRTPLHIHVA